MNNEPLLLRYGKQFLLDNPNIVSLRKQFTYDIDIDADNPIVSNARILEFIHLTFPEIEFKNEHTQIIYKSIPEKGLNWHIDDCQIVFLNHMPSYNRECYKVISTENRKKYLYFNPRTPSKAPSRYTLLFYCSTQGIDFEGGELCLADGMKIIPVKGEGVLMDSREVHMVTPIKSGLRKIVLVKIY